MQALWRRLLLAHAELYPAAEFALMLAALSLLAWLAGVLLRRPLLSSLGWRCLHRLGRRWLPPTLAALRAVACLKAMPRWALGRRYRGTDAPLWAVLLCEAWCRDCEQRADQGIAGAPAQRDRLRAEARRSIEPILNTLATLYAPGAARLRHIFAGAYDETATDRSLWFAACLAMRTRDAAPFKHRFRQLFGLSADDPGAERGLGPLGRDALCSVDLLGADGQAVAAAARHFARSLSADPSHEAEWPGLAARLLPWLDFHAARQDFHALVAAGRTLLERAQLSAALVPVCRRLTLALLRLSQEAKQNGAVAVAALYSRAAQGYEALCADLGEPPFRSSHPLASALPAAPVALPHSAVQREAESQLCRIPALRSPGFWVAATACTLLVLGTVEGLLVARTVQLSRRDSGLGAAREPLQAPAWCESGGGPSQIASDGESVFLLGDRALARYEPRIRHWSCYRLSGDKAPAAAGADTLRELLGADDAITRLHADRRGLVFVTRAGRLGMLRLDGSEARLEIKGGPALELPEPAPGRPGATGQALLTAQIDRSRVALTDGKSLWTYDDRQHGFSPPRALRFAAETQLTALAASASRFWLGTSTGLYQMSALEEDLHPVEGPERVDRLLPVGSPAVAIVSFGDRSCGQRVSHAGYLTLFTESEQQEPRAALTMDGCAAAGPQVASLLDLFSGSETVWALESGALSSYSRRTQQWSTTKLPWRAQAGWLLGGSEIEAVVLRSGDELIAYSTEHQELWRSDGRIAGGPYASGRALSWQARRRGGEPPVTYWATADSRPRVIAAPIKEYAAVARSSVTVAGHRCFAGAAPYPVHCLHEQQGFVRRICSASSDCSWGGKVPTLRRLDDSTIEIALADGRRERLDLAGSPIEEAGLAPLRAEPAPPALDGDHAVTEPVEARGHGLAAQESLIGLPDHSWLVVATAAPDAQPRALKGGSIAATGQCLWLTQPPSSLFRSCDDDHALRPQAGLLEPGEPPRFVRSAGSSLWVIGRRSVVTIQAAAGTLPERAAPPLALPIEQVETALTDGKDLWLAGHDTLLRVSGSQLAEVRKQPARLRALYATPQGPLWLGVNGRARVADHELEPTFEDLACTAGAECLGIADGRLQIFSMRGAAAPALLASVPLPRELASAPRRLAIVEDAQGKVSLHLVSGAARAATDCTANLDGSRPSFRCVAHAGAIPASRRWTRSGPFGFWRSPGAGPTEDSDLTLYGQPVQRIEEHFAHDVLAPGPVERQVVLTGGQLFLNTRAGLLRYPGAGEAGRAGLPLQAAEFINVPEPAQQAWAGPPGRVAGSERMETSPAAVGRIDEIADVVAPRISTERRVRLFARSGEGWLELWTSRRTFFWRARTDAPSRQELAAPQAVKLMPEPPGRREAPQSLKPDPASEPTREPAGRIAELSSLRPIGADSSGIFFRSDGGAITQHAGVAYCGPGCLRAAGQAAPQQLRQVELFEKMSRGASLHCASPAASHPVWTCQMRRSERPPVAVRGALFPTDRVKDLWQDEGGAVHLQDELGFVVDLTATGELSPAPAEPVSPPSERPPSVNGWRWLWAAASPLAAGPQGALWLEHARGLDTLVPVEAGGPRRLRFGHDIVLDAASADGATCRDCLYSILRLHPPRAGAQDADAAATAGPSFLARGSSADPWPDPGRWLPLSDAVSGIYADEEGVLLAFSDRVVELDHAQTWRRAALPLRWPTAAGIQAVRLSRAPGSEQVLVVPPPDRGVAAVLVEPARFRVGPTQPPPLPEQGQVDWPMSVQWEPRQGDRCGEEQGKTLTVLRRLREVRGEWQGWRYRVHPDERRFCRLGTVRAAAEPPATLPQASYAVVVGDQPSDAQHALFSTGAAFDERRRVLLPARGWLIEVLAQPEQWHSERPDPLIALHPLAELWPADCSEVLAVSQEVAAADGTAPLTLAHSSRGCTTALRKPGRARLRFHGHSFLHVALARMFLRRPDPELLLEPDELRAIAILPTPTALWVQRRDSRSFQINADRVFSE